MIILLLCTGLAKVVSYTPHVVDVLSYHLEPVAHWYQEGRMPVTLEAAQWHQEGVGAGYQHFRGKPRLRQHQPRNAGG